MQAQMTSMQQAFTSSPRAEARAVFSPEAGAVYSPNQAEEAGFGRSDSRVFEDLQGFSDFPGRVSPDASMQAGGPRILTSS